MRKLLFATLILISFTAKSQTFSESLMQDTIVRYYDIHYPPNYTSNMPVVINLHGYTSNGWQQEFYSGMSAIADSNNFIVVYPYGLRDNRYWIPFFNCALEEETVDDIDFMNRLIDTLIAENQVDSSRIYVCGMSNGGFMSNYLACELSERVAAIADVAGSMNDSVFYNCNPTRAIPTLQMHGTADSTVPYLGIDSNAFVMGEMHATEDIFDLWKSHNNCSTLDSVLIPDIDTTDFSHAIKYTYSSCDDNVESVLYKIINSGHTWPNGVQIPWQAWVNRDINGSQVIWDFFQQYAINFNPPTLVENIEFASNLYPNPAKNNITIANSYLGKISIYNMMGMEVATFEKTDEQLNINIRNLSSGAYYIACNTIREKFIKL